MKDVRLPAWPFVIFVLVLFGSSFTSQSPGFLLSSSEREILRHMSLVKLPDGHGGFVDTLRITGLNVQIVNGLGATNGNPVNPGSLDPAQITTNGAGNLIVGYNELDATSDRRGSHCIVVGRNNDYTSFGGIVGGTDNGVFAPACTVASGFHNSAYGPRSCVTGGEDNETAGVLASISGGLSNRANGLRSWIGGGEANSANATQSSVAGGGSVVVQTSKHTGVGPLLVVP